ncbi:MAG TPA: hypothetical protein VFY06_12580, partial [Verrucomicrobiae bacterium]|nr:hypothetical protein [Verrucomicrobiae bacterium]
MTFFHHREPFRRKVLPANFLVGFSGKSETTDFDLVIGRNRSNLGADDIGKSFLGSISEPMVWNRALSEKE